MTKITITGELKDMSKLFDYPEKDKQEEEDNYPVKRSIRWRGKRQGCEVYRNDQVITEFENRNGVLVIHYEMAREESVPREFRVPKDNMPFIHEAIEAGILAEGKLLWVSVESDASKHNWWICLEEK